MDYQFTIDKFSGPLDLLLHLIKQSNIDIYDIQIKDITDQYLDYINRMEELNLNIASSYLVMAAELIEMKAAMLLPKPELDNDEYEEDPKERLIKRLLDYQNYKEITSKFHELELDRQQYFTRCSNDLEEFQTSSSLSQDIDLNDLIKAFENFLNRKEESKPLNTKVTTKEYSISLRSKEIKDIVLKNKKVNFVDLFNIKTKSYIVVTFLSILVLAKNNEIRIIQDNNFENILLCGVN